MRQKKEFKRYSPKFSKIKDNKSEVQEALKLRYIPIFGVVVMVKNSPANAREVSNIGLTQGSNMHLLHRQPGSFTTEAPGKPGGYHYHPHCTDEKTEAQRDYVLALGGAAKKGQAFISCLVNTNCIQCR